MENQKYAGGGVILIIKQEEEKYIIFPKRSEGADVINPGSHSGFFGGVDEDKKEEFTKPRLISSRELSEELLIISREKQKIYGIKIDGGHNEENIKKFIKELCILWITERSYLDIEQEVPIKLIKATEIEEIEYIEQEGRKQILKVEIELPEFLDKIYLLDGETKEEKPTPKGLIDRQIDVFNFEEFKKWWFENENSTLNATLSFKSGREIRRGFISREKNKISPSLIQSLNKLWPNKISFPDRNTLSEAHKNSRICS